MSERFFVFTYKSIYRKSSLLIFTYKISFYRVGNFYNYHFTISIYYKRIFIDITA